MAIDFNKLPDNAGKASGKLIEKGPYYAVIEKADLTLKRKKEETDPDVFYINLQYGLTDKNGQPVASKLFDMVSESESAFVQYKTKRFLTATELTELGPVELKDLCKLLPNRKFIVDVTTEKKDNYPEKNVVDVFGGLIYYPMSEADQVMGYPEIDIPNGEDDELPVFNAPDGAEKQETPNRGAY